MFTSSLRRQSPALLRLTNSSIRALISSPSPKSVIARSAPLKSAVLSSSAAQRRFFAVSTYLRDDAYAATQEVLDSDPPAGEYHYSGHGEEHHFGDNESITKFQQLADRGIVDKAIINTITKGMGYEEMTKVQRKTITETVNGDNVLAQAKTGTGKTIAFLLPVLQRILKAQRPLKTPPRAGFKSRDRYSSRSESYADIRAIIVSPTRELATQIAVDARKLSSGTNIVVQTAVGGSGKREGLRDIHQLGCHILIATPGRLLDLLTDPSGVSAPNLEIFVMDEADNLLDVGFANELDKIMDALPPRDQPIGDSGKGRQTLLFSATVPDKVMTVVKKTMGRNYKILRMVEKGEVATHERVQQRLIKCRGLENLIPATYELVLREIAALGTAHEKSGDAEKLPFKAIVFFSATRWTSLAADTFRNLRGDSQPGRDGQIGHHPLYPTKIFEIHSRLTQAQRDIAATRFRNAESAILFSSDVTARGMDFPKVTHVIQVGGPRNHEQYIHRLGRTARGSAEGIGYLIIPEIEHSHVLRDLRDLPLVKDESLTIPRLDLGAEQNLSKSTADLITAITEASMRVPRELKNRTYSALIGLYSALGDKRLMVDSLNRLSTLGWGMEKPPYVSPMLARKMALERIPGLNMVRDEEDFTSGSEDSEFGGRGGFSRGGSGGGRGGFGGSRGGFGGGFGGGGGSRGSSRPWEGRGSQSGDRNSRAGFGGPNRNSRNGFGDRPSYENRESSGERGGFSSSRGRGRGGFSRDGDSGGRPSYGDRDSGYGSSEGRPNWGRPVDPERRGGKRFGGGLKGGVAHGGRTSPRGYEGDNFGGLSKSDRDIFPPFQNRIERGVYGQKMSQNSFETPFSKINQSKESSFHGPRIGRGGSRSGSGMSRFDD